MDKEYNTSEKQEWFYVEPSPNNHLQEDSERLLSANGEGGNTMDP